MFRAWLQPAIDGLRIDTIAASALNFDIPLVTLVPASKTLGGLYVLELFHGPTLSFKDVGARSMAHLVSHFSRASGEALTILVATSGDTGSAVADGFSGLPGVRVVLLYPKGQVSPLQERQLIVRRPGVTALAVEGTFDDCQRMVKEAFALQDLSNANLTSANSINIGRLMPQSVYYMHAVAQLGEADVLFVTPSGNLGNLTAGVLARRSGLPVRRFVAAHNANAFFPDYLTSGDDSFRDSIRTLSNAMDVGAPSNFERLASLYSRNELADLLWSTSVSDEETLVSMKQVYDDYGYIADPHTAVGLDAARRYRETDGDRAPVIVLSTAHPAKFPLTVKNAIGIEPETPARLAKLLAAETSVSTIARETNALLPHIAA